MSLSFICSKLNPFIFHGFLVFSNFLQYFLDFADMHGIFVTQGFMLVGKFAIFVHFSENIAVTLKRKE